MLNFLSKYFHFQKRKQQTVYQIMIDRFANGSKFLKNNIGVIPPPFLGGNIKGIIKRLNYIEGLGTNSILLSPFFKSNAYHGYHCTTSSNEIEPQFGNEEDIRRLVKQIKERKMTCGADFVPNHCHITNPIYVKHADWFEFPNKEHKFYANIKDLPVLNLDHPEALKYMIKQALQLCEWGFNYIRIDHVDRILYYCKNIDKVKEVLDFTYSWKRPVVIYYGTEQGMSNKTAIHQVAYDDESVRLCMDWNNINKNVFKTIYPCRINE